MVHKNLLQARYSKTLSTAAHNVSPNKAKGLFLLFTTNTSVHTASPLPGTTHITCLTATL